MSFMRTMRRKVSSVRGLKVRRKELPDGKERIQVVSYGPVVVNAARASKKKTVCQRKA